MTEPSKATKARAEALDRAIYAAPLGGRRAALLAALQAAIDESERPLREENQWLRASLRNIRDNVHPGSLSAAFAKEALNAASNVPPVAAAKLHNPNALTMAQVGVSEGRRLPEEPISNDSGGVESRNAKPVGCPPDTDQPYDGQRNALSDGAGAGSHVQEDPSRTSARPAVTPSADAPTMETDAAWEQCPLTGGLPFMRKLARKLERERDEARRERDQARAELGTMLDDRTAARAALSTEHQLRERAEKELDDTRVAHQRQQTNYIHLYNAVMGGSNTSDLKDAVAVAISSRVELAQAKEDTELLWSHCRIVYWPGNPEYPLEHNPHARKDMRSLIESALAARAASKEGK